MVIRNEDITAIWEGSPRGLVLNGHYQQWIEFQQIFIVNEMLIIVFV